MNFARGESPSVAARSNLEPGAALGGGARNVIYRAHDGRDDFVVRLSRRTVASLDWELDLLEHLTGHGITVPKTIATDDGRRHDSGLVVQRFITGRPPESESDWKRVHGTMKKVHETTVGWPQRPGFASARALLHNDRGGDVDLRTMPLDVVQLIRDAWAPVSSEFECAVHGDLNAGNVLLTDTCVALIDWDEARVDVPAFDFAGLSRSSGESYGSCRPGTLRRAALAWEVATCWTTEPDYARRQLAELQSIEHRGNGTDSDDVE